MYFKIPQRAKTSVVTNSEQKVPDKEDIRAKSNQKHLLEQYIQY